jgi:hypothetical protein
VVASLLTCLYGDLLLLATGVVLHNSLTVSLRFVLIVDQFHHFTFSFLTKVTCDSTSGMKNLSAKLGRVPFWIVWRLSEVAVPFSGNCVGRLSGNSYYLYASKICGRSSPTPAVPAVIHKAHHHLIVGRLTLTHGFCRIRVVLVLCRVVKVIGNLNPAVCGNSYRRFRPVRHLPVGTVARR